MAGEAGGRRGWSRREEIAAGGGEQAADFVVGGLAEVKVVLADGVEGIGNEGADDVVCLAEELYAGGRCTNRRGEDEGMGARANGAGGGAHAGAGGEAVVDEDDGAALDGKRRAAFAEARFEIFEFAAGVVLNRLQCGGGEAQVAEDVGVKGDGAAAGDGAEREFGLAGSAQLAHSEDVERQVEGVRDLAGDGNTSTGEGEDDGLMQAGERSEGLGKGAACVSAVLIHMVTATASIVMRIAADV